VHEAIEQERSAVVELEAVCIAMRLKPRGVILRPGVPGTPPPGARHYVQ